jgi:hypothetical protein
VTNTTGVGGWPGVGVVTSSALAIRLSNLKPAVSALARLFATMSSSRWSSTWRDSPT